MVGVDVGLQGGNQNQAKLVDQGRIAPHPLEHRIDQDRLAVAAVTEQIRVGR